eukprot:scaffold4936_cov73-Phaeocystis_antarctica.AAC.8
MDALKEGVNPVPAPLKGGPGRLVEQDVHDELRHQARLSSGRWCGEEQARRWACICGVAAHRMCCQQPRCKASNLDDVCQAEQGLICCRDHLNRHALLEDIEPLARERINNRCMLRA